MLMQDEQYSARLEKQRIAQRRLRDLAAGRASKDAPVKAAVRSSVTRFISVFQGSRPSLSSS